MIPAMHRAFVERAVALFAADARFVGVAAAGSWISQRMDEHSDVDLVAIARPEALEDVMRERRTILATLGPLLVTFSGEHVGEPRLMISLYGPPLLHVDVKFVGVDALAARVENPVVLWERDGAVRAALAAGEASWPQPDRQWIEDRFWVWIHYGATKVARGELFEAIDLVTFLRRTALAPLGALLHGERARGVRFVERDLPSLAAEMRATVCGYDAQEIRRALRACVTLYRHLRDRGGPRELQLRSDAEVEAVAFLDRA